MKKLVLGTALLIALSTFSFSAFAFIPQMGFFVNGQIATTRVFNTAGAPMVCSGYAFGQTYNGVVLNSWFNQVYVAPGAFVDAYVYSNGFDPFVNAWAQVDCGFAW